MRRTRRVIEAFPEDQLFTFSIGGMRTFGELAMEIITMGAPMVRGAVSGDWNADWSRDARPKQEVIDNEIHHRGQGYVYLRALGIEPPPFYERG